MNKTTIIRIILAIITLAIFATIFKDSVKSEEQSRPIAEKIVEIEEFLLKKQFKDRELKLDNVDLIIRKLAHFSIYTIAGLALMSLLSTFNIENKKKLEICLLIGFLYAVSDEIHQFLCQKEERCLQMC